jgi:long-chain acyl-CoA synthetase
MTSLARTVGTRFADETAAMFLRDGAWQTMTYAELWARVDRLARGLVDLGVGVGDRVAVLANTRVEFTIVNLAINTAGAIVVPVYPTNSADECEWVVGNSGAVAIFCENEAHVSKIRGDQANLPDLRDIVTIDGPVAGTLSIDDLAARGDVVGEAVLDERAGQVALADPCLIIYTSGTTGRPKGVVLSHEGFAAGRFAAAEMDIFDAGEIVYLFLPLAHVFGQLVQADALEMGATIAYWGGDANRIVPELGEVRPHCLPSVPRIFEKVYSVASGMIPPERQELAAAAVELGVKVREAQAAGEEVPEGERTMFELADQELFGHVRNIFGGRIKLAISGAAPIAPEVLRFFYAAGVPVMEGWGMTETTGIGTFNQVADHKFGTIGKPVAGADVRIADDGEIQIAGSILLKEYWKNPEATADVMTDDGYLCTGDLGSIDEDGFVRITGRKKDIIITAGGKNLTPANLEGDLRRSRWVSQVVMYGDRRPYPVALVTLDAEEVLPWAAAKGYPTDLESLAQNEELTGMIQAELDAANEKYARVEQIKRFKILSRDFTLDSGELTPSLKLKRNVVYERCADDFAGLYED